MSDKASTHDLELAFAESLEKSKRAKQGARKGCPFCGNEDIQALVRPIVNGVPVQPAIPTASTSSGAHFPVHLMVCSNCDFLMPFAYNDSVPFKV